MGERRTFPQKGVLSPKRYAKANIAIPELPNADPHLGEGYNIRVFIIGYVLAFFAA